MKQFTNIRKMLLDEYEKTVDEYVNKINVGYIDDDYSHRNNPDMFIRRYSTDLRWRQYSNGEITRDQAAYYAKKRKKGELEKEYQKQLDRLERIEAAGELVGMNIGVEWGRNGVYGRQAKASISYSYKTPDGYTRYDAVDGEKTGGCGYDKHSSAISYALNKIPAALKLLYRVADENPTESMENLVGYGVGSPPYLRFDYGVGVSSFQRVFDNLGYYWRNGPAGVSFDTHIITKTVNPDD